MLHAQWGESSQNFKWKAIISAYYFIVEPLVGEREVVRDGGGYVTNFRWRVGRERSITCE